MNDLKIKAYGCLRSDSPFKQIFPTGIVPLKSIVAVMPEVDDAPLCYLIDAGALSAEQTRLLAQRIYELWHPKCESFDYAIACVKKGLPLKIDWFTTVGTDYSLYA